MSLYLCLYAGDREVEGLEVGPYADFNALRRAIVGTLPDGEAERRYPTLLLHSDCDGEWAPEACGQLRQELAAIIAAMKVRPAMEFPSDWQKEMARSAGLQPCNAFECFIDVDGEFLLDRLQRLADRAWRERRPILFQ